MADPVTLAEAKAHLRVTSSSEDGVIQGCLDAACQHVESLTGQVLEPREVVERLDFLCNGRLRSWPVQSVVSASYVDTAGQVQLIEAANYSLVGQRRPARLQLIGMPWPFSRPIEITVAAGYATPAEVPAALRLAILVATGHFYRDREGAEGMPAAVEALCRPHRLMTV